ncbi:Protein CBG10474 [Caenorhabditis briggsae]|uniref:Guanylate cyclase n=1 Tax=Caenorhabditis briggsae TaxID=6238 RepID=A8XBB0_CAEBR|nr:Protein CBG10474 [Caenorhabditis briggsae]CAP29890.1 Protein CBG10474 [Caenorhabditis briggsae]
MTGTKTVLLTVAVFLAHNPFVTAIGYGNAGSCPKPFKFGNGPPASCPPPADPNNKPASQLESWSIQLRHLTAFFAHAIQETGKNNIALYDTLSQEDASNCFYRGGSFNWFEGGPRHTKDVISVVVPFKSHNYNYGQFREWLKSVYITVDLLNEPNLLMTEMNPPLAMIASLWFYMTPQPPKPAMHDIVMGNWNSGAENRAAGYTGPIFGPTSLIINNECGGEDPQNPGSAGESRRIKAFKLFYGYFNVPTGEQLTLSCKNMQVSLDRIQHNLSYQIDWSSSWKNAPCDCVPANFAGLIYYDDPAYYPASFVAQNEINRQKCIASVYANPSIFCARGSLADVIAKASLQMDGFFIYSLMKDIVNGLTWIHESSHGCHGMLTSKCCLLNDRWQLKITDFGLSWFRTHDQLTKTDRLWTAPELLRNDDLLGSREGDIYSLGIISAELITRSSVFGLENRKEDPEEIVYKLKKGGLQSPRPNLEHDESLEINPALLHLVRDCWTERPSERPDIKQVGSQLRSMNTNRNDNLMDHVFNVLESYASTLEDEVAERMKELVEEKKKSDVLLYRMLPKQVADKLKIGQTVEPETFDLVTLFFSDVVSFTTLAGKCTPLQVINLLNGLYTIFDGIIEQHDVYKVETIGDGYFVASGVPRWNGNEHTRNIASMSLCFVKSIAGYKVPHLPGEKINIRVGFHCGSVVAGVVGLTMPRYCLFGDAVNTASRMESNSKPGQIHISQEANEMLMRLGGFTTEPRGEVIVKGKGVMNTYWLKEMTESADPRNMEKKD